jgi:hypothetical protein
VATLTWGPGPSSDPGSGATAAFAAAAAVVATAAGAPGGDHPQVLLATASPTVVVVVVAADPMAVVAEDWRASTRPLPGSRSPWPCQQSYDASGSRPPWPQRGGVRNRRSVGTMQPTSPLLLRHPSAAWAEELLAAPLPLSKGRGAAVGAWETLVGALGASNRHIGDPDPAIGVPAASLANRDAALVEGRQRGQNHRPQPCVVAERRDALGED